MFSKVKRERVGAVLVLAGFLALIGIAGTSDIGRISSVLAMIGEGIVCLAVMTAGAFMIGGEPDEDTL